MASATLAVGLILYWALSLPALFLFALAVGIVSVFEHSWLLQAEGQVRKYVTADLIARAVTLISWIVLSRFDVSTLTALTAVGVGFIARSIYTEQKTKVDSKLISRPQNIVSLIKSASPIAVSKFLNSTTNQLTPLLFGLTSSLANVGTFASADKPIRALQAGANSYAVFALPKIARQTGTTNFIPSVVRHLITVASLSAGLAFIIVLFAPSISWLLVGSVDETLIACIRIMAAIPVFTSINNLVTVAITPLIDMTSINLYAALVGAVALGLVFIMSNGPLTPELMALGVTFVEFSITASSVSMTLMFVSRNRRVRA
jgi:O-antigen/teichoic acid export membrane protein